MTKNYFTLSTLLDKGRRLSGKRKRLPSLFDKRYRQIPSRQNVFDEEILQVEPRYGSKGQRWQTLAGIWKPPLLFSDPKSQ